MKKPKSLPLILLALATASCAGMRQTGDTYTAHAETFHILGLSIGGNDHEEAWEMVPDGVEPTTVVSSPSDWSSLVGILTNILGVSSTQISWQGAPPKTE